VSAPLDHLALRTLLFAVVAASSPLALGSVIAVVTSARGRMKGAAFAIGFVTGQAVFFLLALSLGTITFGNSQNHPTLIAVLLIAFGAALLLTAVWVRGHRTEPVRVRGPNPRTEAFRARLASLRPLSALAAGAALGVGGPKRLSITIAVTAMITESGVGNADALGLAVLYVGVSTVLVWAAALFYILWGQRATEWLTGAQHWSVRHKEPLMFYPSVVLGLVLVIDGVVQLLG
jgi:hypothetical protein